MKKYIITILLSTVILAGCSKTTERKIKLTNTVSQAIAQEKIETVQIAASKKENLAIVHFYNETSDSTFDWLELGIVDMLSSDLSQASQIFITPSSKVAQASREIGLVSKQSPEYGKKIAQNVNANSFLCGKFSMNNKTFEIKAELWNSRTNQIEKQFAEQGDGIENVFTMVDRLSKKIREHLAQNGKGASPDIDMRLVDATTNNLDAYKYFAKGVEAELKLYKNQAITYFKQAIELDSTFAAAHVRLAQNYMESGKMDEARKTIKNASEFIEKLPKLEQLNILASQSLLDGQIHNAMKIYEEIVELYPQIDEAHFQLGQMYYSLLQDYERAIEQYEMTVALNPQHKLAINQLAYNYAAIGNVKMALTYLDDYINIADNEPNPYDSYGEILYNLGKIDRSIKYFEKALQLDENFYHSRLHLVNAYLDAGEFRKAERLTKKLVKESKTDQEKATFYRLLARVSYIKGNTNKALSYLDDAYKVGHNRLQTITTRSLIDKDLTKSRQQFQDWYHEEFLTTDDNSVLKAEKVVNLVISSLHLGILHQEASESLDSFIKTQTDPAILQSALAFRLILDLNTSGFNPETIFAMDKFSSSQWMTATSYEMFWQFFFKGFMNQDNLEKTERADFVKRRDQMLETENLHFAVQQTYAIGLYDYLHDDFDNMYSEMQFIGSPVESQWDVLGPFDIRKGLHQKFWPETVDFDSLLNYDEKHWVNGYDDIFDGYLDMKKMTNAGNNSGVYALLTINSPQERQVDLRFGTSGPLKVWLNNQQVMTQNYNGNAILDQFKIPVDINPGQNYLLVRVSAPIGNIGLYFRATDKDGYGFEDISFGRAQLNI